MIDMLIIEVPVTPRPVMARRPEVYQSSIPGLHGRPLEASAIAALERGRDNLTRYGWVQDSMGDRVQGFCTVGALLADQDVTVDAVRYLARAAGVDVGTVDAWNDTPGRTLADVLDAYDHAIKFAREDDDDPLAS